MMPCSTSAPVPLGQWLTACPLIAILRGITPEEAPAVGQVLWRTGFRILEVPLNSPEPYQSITALRQSLPQALVGAGTVMSAQQVSWVQAAGGQMVISPHIDTRVVQATKALGLLSVPGIATPTEAFTALEAGADAVKLFPAEMLGPAAVKAMRAVLPRDALLLPVGGIGSHNMSAYWQAGANGFGIGSSLYSPGKALADLERDATQLIANYSINTGANC